jgi:hypothetical protein
MDFNTFVITGPSTLTATIGFETGGTQTYLGGVKYNYATQCQTDTFSMTGVPGGIPPVMCGTNSGYHSKLTNSSIFHRYKYDPNLISDHFFKLFFQKMKT